MLRTAVLWTLAIIPLLSLPFNEVKAEDKAPVTVEVNPVHFQQYARPIRTSGILSYKSQQTLSFKTAGPVSLMLVDEGHRVKEGQLLASLALDEINAQVDETKARVKMAKRSLARYRKLHDNNVLSLDKLQAAETDLAVAESKLRIALFNRNYSSIKASADGLILRRHVEQNELVSPYQPIIILADESQGWVIRSGITDQDIVRVREGDRAEVIFDAFPDQVFTGTVSELAALANERTGTFEVEISLPTAVSQLRSGFVGQIKILPETMKNLALVPVEAVIAAQTDSHSNASVLIYNPQSETAEKRQVYIEFMELGQVAISSGLQENELLITTGAGLLRHGEKARLSTKGLKKYISGDQTGVPLP